MVIGVMCISLLAPIARATTCADGWESNSSGSGTCSWHGGILDSGSSQAGSGQPSLQMPSFHAPRRFSSPDGLIQCYYEPRKGRLRCSSYEAQETIWLYKNRPSRITYTTLPFGGAPLDMTTYYKWQSGPFECAATQDSMLCSVGLTQVWIDKTGVDVR